MTGSVASTTPYFGFNLVRFNSSRWQDYEWDNWRVLDAALNAVSNITNLMGAWQNATAYEIGNRVVDTDEGLIYQCAVAHTSSSTNTFDEERTEHPTYWDEVTSFPDNRGAWTTATEYNINDYVTDGYRVGLVVENYTSGASYDADVSAGNIVTLVDLTDTVEAASNYAEALTATSTTSISVGTGAKVFTTQSGKQFATGQRLRISNSGATRVMDGEVTSYSGTTLTMDIDYTEGSGSDTAWIISIVGARGAQGDTGPAGPGSGDVVGPAGATTLRIVVFDGGTGKLIADSGSTIANVLDRANHTGTQAQSTITNLTTDLAAKIANTLLTTTGDVIYASGANTPARLAIGAANYIFKSTGTIPEWGLIVAANVTDGTLTFAKLQDFDALSVLGRSGNTNGVADEITAGTDHQVLRRSGNSLGFGAINLAQAAAVTGILPAANLPDATATAEGIGEMATAAELFNDTQGNKFLTPEAVWDAGVPTALSDAATIAWDMSLGIDFSVTIAGNRTLGNPTNVTVGKRGVIIVTASASDRTLNKGANILADPGYSWPITISSGTYAILGYWAKSSTEIIITGIVNGPS